MAKKSYRPDRDGKAAASYRKNRKIILESQTICGICGQPVDFSKKYPDPMSPCVDHIIPVDKGGHPSDLNNLQLAHLWCNRQKSDKILAKQEEKRSGSGKGSTRRKEEIDNRILPLSIDWTQYRKP